MGRRGSLRCVDWVSKEGLVEQLQSAQLIAYQGPSVRPYQHFYLDCRSGYFNSPSQVQLFVLLGKYFHQPVSRKKKIMSSIVQQLLSVGLEEEQQAEAETGSKVGLRLNKSEVARRHAVSELARALRLPLFVQHWTEKEFEWTLSNKVFSVLYGNLCVKKNGGIYV